MNALSKLHEAMERTFRGIYFNQNWFHGSGSGSLPENTEVYRGFIERFLRTHDIKTVLDLGCGDWQSTRLMNWDGLEYTGIDIVPTIIEAAKTKYANDHIRFICADIIECDLPPADVVILKDVLQHWPNDVVHIFLQKLQKYQYVLITNTVESQRLMPAGPQPIPEITNRDIELGQSRSFDIAQPPFQIPCQELLRYISTKRHAPVQDIKSIVLVENS